MNKEITNFDYGLFAKYVTGNIKPEEMSQILNWRSESADNERLFSEIFRLRVSWNYTQYNSSEQLSVALEKVNKRVNQSNRYQLVRKIAQYAAIVLFAIGASIYFWKTPQPQEFTTIAVAPDTSMKKLLLEDGSVIWLRGNSEIKIPTSFSAQNRNIKLTGEAFFDIATDSIHHFIVETDFMAIEVKGTQFNVKTDEQEKNIETTLVSGAVDLLNQKREKLLAMLPGEKATYSQSENRLVTEQIDINTCAAWRYNQLVFENATLREICNQLSSKFDIHINIDSSGLASKRFRCVVNEDETLTDVLNLLSFLAPISFNIEGDEIFIKNKKK